MNYLKRNTLILAATAAAATSGFLVGERLGDVTAKPRHENADRAAICAKKLTQQVVRPKECLVTEPLADDGYYFSTPDQARDYATYSNSEASNSKFATERVGMVIGIIAATFWTLELTRPKETVPENS